MKRVFTSVVFAICFLFAAQAAYACSCVVSDSGKTPTIEESRKFYSENYKDPVFTGKVIRIEDEEITDPYQTGATDFKILMHKVTIDVEKYWLNVDKPQMVIYTGVGGGDCGVRFTKSESYFFNPSMAAGRLSVGICDYPTNNSLKTDGGQAKFFTELFGAGKVFAKKEK